MYVRAILSILADVAVRSLSWGSLFWLITAFVLPAEYFAYSFFALLVPFVLWYGPKLLGMLRYSLQVFVVQDWDDNPHVDADCIQVMGPDGVWYSTAMFGNINMFAKGPRIGEPVAILLSRREQSGIHRDCIQVFGA